MAEAWVPSSHIAFHAFTLTSSAVTPSAVGSNPAAGAWPDRQRRPHPRFDKLLGVWERWACFFAVMAPSGPARINQSHINQGQGRNR